MPGRTVTAPARPGRKSNAHVADRLIAADGGGCNASRVPLWKLELQRLGCFPLYCQDTQRSILSLPANWVTHFREQ